MKVILLVGGSGFIGRALGESLARKGYTLRLLTRSKQKALLPFPLHNFSMGWKAGAKGSPCRCTSCYQSCWRVYCWKTLVKIV